MIYSKKYMKKKIVKSKKLKAHKGPTLMDKLPKNHGEWLMLCIRLTQKARNGEGAGGFLNDQVQRLTVQLEEWKSLNPSAELRNL